jgi:hypothetical protein
MPTGRLVLRAYSPLYDTEWSPQWEEQTPGELVQRVGEIVVALEGAVPPLVEQAAEARRRWEERPRWTLQNRPLVDRSKPATRPGDRDGAFYLTPSL